LENQEAPLSKTLHLSSLGSDMPAVYVLSEIRRELFTTNSDMAQRRIRLPVVVTVRVTVCVGTVFRTNRLGAENMRDFVRLC